MFLLMICQMVHIEPGLIQEKCLNTEYMTERTLKTFFQDQLLRLLK